MKTTITTIQESRTMNKSDEEKITGLQVRQVVTATDGQGVRAVFVFARRKQGRWDGPSMA